MYVKPADGLRIRDYRTLRLMSPEGEEVEDTDFYWNRLLRDGDVVECDPPAPTAPAASSKSTAPAAAG